MSQDEELREELSRIFTKKYMYYCDDGYAAYDVTSPTNHQIEKAINLIKNYVQFVKQK